MPSAPEPQTSPAAQSSSQETPGQTSRQEKNDQGAVDRTRDLTKEAAHATVRMGEEAIVRARDWESSWLTGIYVGTGAQRMPLTFPLRRELYLQQTLLTPGAYMKRMFTAGFDQARGTPPQWQGGIGGYGQRFASREGQFITANTLAWLGNAALRYEPRYDQCNCSGFWPRTRHAILRNFVTYNRSEQQLRPQWALYGGAFGGGLVSATWKPQPRNVLGDGGIAVLGQAGYGSLLNLFIEFSQDINRKIGARKRDIR